MLRTGISEDKKQITIDYDLFLEMEETCREFKEFKAGEKFFSRNRGGDFVQLLATKDLVDFPFKGYQTYANKIAELIDDKFKLQRQVDSEIRTRVEAVYQKYDTEEHYTFLKGIFQRQSRCIKHFKGTIQSIKTNWILKHFFKKSIDNLQTNIDVLTKLEYQDCQHDSELKIKRSRRIAEMCDPIRH